MAEGGIEDKEMEQKDMLSSDQDRNPAISPQTKESVGQFLEAVSKGTEKFDLKGGFYTEEEQTAKPLDIKEVEDRHRSANFPHVRHQYGLQVGHAPKKKHHHHHHHRHKYIRPVSDNRQLLTERTEAIPEVLTAASINEGFSADDAPASQRDVAPASSSTPALSVTTPDSVFRETPKFELGAPLDSDTEETDGQASAPSLVPDPRHSKESVDGLSPDNKVSFHLGSLGDSTGGEIVNLEKKGAYDEEEDKEKHSAEDKTPDPEPKKDHSTPRHKKSTGHRSHHDRIPSEREIAMRRKLGSEIQLEGMGRGLTESERAEENILGDAVLEEMESHRFADAKGLRKRKSRPGGIASIVHIGKADKVKKPTPKTKKFDHSPHEMFVELDELFLGEDQEWVWQEKARWIKFEEDMEVGGGRWGKPHVASLSFHSLLELRQCLERGVCLLDIEADDLPTIANIVVDKFITMDQLDPMEKGKVLKALLLKHRHVGDEKTHFLRRNLSYLNLGLLSENVDSADLEYVVVMNEGQVTDSHRGSVASTHSNSLSDFLGAFPTPEIIVTQNGGAPSAGEEKDSKKIRETKITMDEIKKPATVTFDKTASSVAIPDDDEVGFKPESGSTPQPKRRKTSLGDSKHKSSVADFRRREHEKHTLRRIPEGAEATTVLVGAMDFLRMPIMAFVRLAKGSQLGNLTEVPLPVRFLFVLLGPADGSLNYYEIGRSVSTLMANTDFHDVAYRADGKVDLLDAINSFLDESIVLPPGELDKSTLLPIMDMARKKKEKKKRTEEPLALEQPDKYGDPLRRTKRMFGGLVNDVKRRYPWYLSDLKDGLNPQCLAAFFFIYFAALSPAITFGGLLGDKTDKWMGVSELLIMTCVGGVVMALFAGQPLVIAGFTGPILIFEEALYSICGSVGLEYLPFRAWIGMWVTVIALVFVMLEGSVFIRHVTRFLEEIFSLLISLIFIYEVFYKLYVIFKNHPLRASYSPPPEDLNVTNSDFTVTTEPYNYLANFTVTTEPYNDVWNVTEELTPESSKLLNQPNTALLALILTFGTFLIALFLRNFRNSKFLGRPVRRALGDFGVPIAIIVMVLIDFGIQETYTEKLDVPDGMTPTAPEKRGWLINPLGIEESLPIWAYFAAIIPALLVCILIFMETLITSLIINKKDRNLKKGSGYHLDILLIGLLSTFAGILGMPLLTVATVRSVTHVSSLSVFSRTHAPGEKPKLVEVKEQRITGLAVHIMIGVSVLLGPVLRQVPLAVLFGVFLYMGVASLSGLQLFERIELLFMPTKHHPDVPYVKRVRTAKMHLYTFIQIFGLVILWIVKSTQAALAFPFFIIMLIPVRLKLLGYIFTSKELIYLDHTGEVPLEEEAEEDEPDFYEQAHMPM